LLAIEHRRALFGLIPLWIHRVRIPLPELAVARVATHVRLQCVTVAVTLAAAVAMFELPLWLGAVLVVLALVELLLAFGPMKALHVERTDGRSWTVPFCHVHLFDASLALEEALQGRDALATTVGEVRGVLPRPGLPHLALVHERR
jgi:hypothetical protein